MKKDGYRIPFIAFLAALVFLVSCTTAATTPADQQAVPTSTTAADTAAVESTAAAEPTALPAATDAVPATGGDASTTTTAYRFTLVPGQGEARYRVREQLANRDLPNDAVGKTSQVSGSITILEDGTIDTSSSQFSVDASTLATDESRRDNYVRRNILQTDQYQYVTFIPTATSGLPSPLPTAGLVEFQLTGDLTIRDITKSVTWTVTGQVEDGTATGTATTSFKFADFNLTQPRVPIVLSVVDKITLELDLTIEQVNQ